MRKMFLLLMAAAFVLTVGFVVSEAAVKEQQVFKKAQNKTWDRQDVAGGKGTLAGKFAYTRNDAKPEYVIKEIGWMSLKPGESIGMHQHTNNEDSYIILSGTGEFTDSDGTVVVVNEGDVTIARAGQSHALKNIGKVPLLFLDIIGQNSSK
ncbi:MAG: cupin domain-containing protein [Elusimicrobiota bacterium]|jgi:mannose-6-phosphate isomerase-like protein (cupin superfamily)|nr:cupin domain-containing protein [Elusimicrobiota bacterium]